MKNKGRTIPLWFAIVLMIIASLLTVVGYYQGYYVGHDEGWFDGYDECEELYWDLMDEMADQKDECMIELCEYKEMAWCP